MFNDEERPTIPENSVPVALDNEVTHLRVIDNTGKSKRIARGNMTYNASQVNNVPYGGISSETVQNAINELEDSKAEQSALTGGLNLKLNISDIADGTGAGTEVPMSQKATTDELALKEVKSNKVTSMSGSSTDTQYPSAKSVYDADQTIIADEKAVAPQIAFNKRVVADGGTVRSKAFMQRVFEANKDLLSDADIILYPEAGAKVASGKLASVYDMAGTNDAVQATDGSRFYAGSTIADNEKLNIKSIEGMAAVSLGFTDIVKANTANWSMLWNGKCNNVGSARIYFGTAYLAFTATEIILHNGTSAILTGTYALQSGLNTTIECRYQAGNGVILVNGFAIPTVAATLGVTFGEITFNASYPFDGNQNGFVVIGRALTAFESQDIAEFLSAEFPAIETIAVGSQQVATSNLEATVLGGTAIPEVTDNAAWAALSTPAWSHYDNSPANGAIYGKLFNGYAVDAINANAPQGFHVPSELEWTQLSEYLGGNTVSGGKLKALYGGFDNAFATNESGVSLLAGGYRASNGVFGYKNLLSGNHNNSGVSLIWGYDSHTVSTIRETKEGYSIRLFSNTPHLEKLTYDSGWFATDIASSPKAIRIPFGCKVTNIKCITTTSVTAIEAKLFNYAGTELETLITGKACNATTKSFSVTADQSVSYTDNYVRVTAAGNSGNGMIIYVTIEPV